MPSRYSAFYHRRFGEGLREQSGADAHSLKIEDTRKCAAQDTRDFGFYNEPGPDSPLFEDL